MFEPGLLFLFPTKDFLMSATPPTIAIVGASQDRSKFGNKAVRAFRDEGWDVYPVNPGLTEVEGIPAYPDLTSVPVEYLDRVSLYVPPRVGLDVIKKVAMKHVGELWLNPGTASPELVSRARALGLNVIQGCSIVDIGRLPSEY